MSQGKVKGTIMIEVVKFLRSTREEARKVVPARLQHYLDSRILATSWHPEEDYLELMRAVIELFPRSGNSLDITSFEAASRASSGNYFEGPYKSLVRRGEPARTLTSLKSLWRLRHDTGEFEIEAKGDKAARVVLRDYALVARESCELVQGTLWGMLHHSGAEGIRLTHTRCRARGAEACEWDLTWD
jgi:uncharacterized protein (TIGR02265 family)